MSASRAATSLSLQHIGAHAHNLRLLSLDCIESEWPTILLTRADCAASPLWYTFCAGLPQLRYLAVWLDLTDEHLEVVCRCCPQLQYLRVVGCSSVTDAALRHVGLGLGPRLLSLSLGDGQLSDHAVACLLDSCPLLQCLVLLCDGMTAATAELLATPGPSARWPHLLSFYISDALNSLPCVRSCPRFRRVYSSFLWPHPFAADPGHPPAAIFSP